MKKSLFIRKELEVNDTLMNFTMVVDSLPLKAGIDPRHILIDRVFDDNIKTVIIE